MGQKVNPIGLRLGITKKSASCWYMDKKNFAKSVNSDYRIRQFLRAKLAHASVSQIYIERLSNNVVITIHTARPGIVLGKKGEDVEKLKKEVSNLAHQPVQIKIEEVRKPDLDSLLVAQSIAQQLERRIMFRRAMKRAVSSALRGGALGIKVCVSGRLGGAEIARTEWYREGRVPLHTLRADIDYGVATAQTTYGVIGVKVWIFKGEIMGHENKKEKEEAAVIAE